MWEVSLNINIITYQCFYEVNKTDDVLLWKNTAYKKCSVFKYIYALMNTSKISHGSKFKIPLKKYQGYRDKI